MKKKHSTRDSCKKQSNVLSVATRRAPLPPDSSPRWSVTQWCPLLAKRVHKKLRSSILRTTIFKTAQRAEMAQSPHMVKARSLKTWWTKSAAKWPSSKERPFRVLSLSIALNSTSQSHWKSADKTLLTRSYLLKPRVKSLTLWNHQVQETSSNKCRSLNKRLR